MRVFVCEFVTGGGFHRQPLPTGLAREGDLMVSALVKDLADIQGVDVMVARDARLVAPDLNARFVAPPLDRDPWLFWDQCMDEADAVWPIAPETGGVLERLSQSVLNRRRILLGSRPEAVALTASKLATAFYLGRCNVPVVPAFPASNPPADGADGWVLKPDDGAGSEDTFRLLRAEEASLFVSADARQGFVVQPFAPGTAVSLSLLCRDGEARLLSCNRQTISLDGARFRYRGGTVGGLEDRRAAYEPIAGSVASAIPGLWGYIGIDLIDGTDGPKVLEVNPRLTTSYIALRAALGVNPARLILDLLDRPLTAPASASDTRAVTIDLEPVDD